LRFAVFALVGELLGRNATRWVRQCQSTSSQPVPERAGPTLGGETVTQAREAQVDLAAGERLPRRVPRQRIDDDLGGGAPSSSWPIRFSQTPPLRADGQQLGGGGQPDGIGLGSHEIRPGLVPRARGAPFHITRSHQSESPRFQGIATRPDRGPIRCAKIRANQAKAAAKAHAAVAAKKAAK